MYTEYSEVPLLLFLKIAKDESKINLLGYKDDEKAKEFWEHCKDKWDEKHPSSEWVARRSQYKKCVKLSVKINKEQFFLQYFLSSKLVPSEEVFKEAGFKYSTDHISVCKKIQKSIIKDSNQLKIYTSQYESMIKETSNKEAIEKEEISINETLASLELATGQTYEYQKITIGEYEGRHYALNRKHEQLKAQTSGRR